MNNELNISNLEIEELKKINKYTVENINKIKKGYPVQYIIGYVNFYGLKININKSTLIPRYETEYLVEKLIKYIKIYKFNNPKILDLCTGSGCIGLALKHELQSSIIHISDISKKALEIAKYNKKELNLDVEIYESDLLENIKEKDYDIIISNPPYVMENEELPNSVLYEPHIALFSGLLGINHIEKILKNAQNYLKNEFIIALEINEKSENNIKKLIEKYMAKEIIYFFEKDLSNKTRYLFIIKKNLKNNE